MARPLDQDQIDEARQRRSRRQSIETIALAMGISKSAVHRAVVEVGVDRRDAANKKRTATEPPWLDEARKLLNAGRKRHAVAKQLNIATSLFYRKIEKFGA